MFILRKFNIIPPVSEMIFLLNNLFLKYGIPIIAFSSFIEHLVGVNVYFPGSVVIVTAMTLASGNLPLAVAVFSRSNFCNTGIHYKLSNSLFVNKEKNRKYCI